MFLQVLEQEVMYNETHETKVSYTSKNIEIKFVQKVNLSAEPTKFFLQGYEPTFFEKLQLKDEKCCLILTDN
jgi:hypothetical protein